MLNVLPNISANAAAAKQRAGIAVVQEGVAAVGVQLPDYGNPSLAQYPLQLSERPLKIIYMR